jgi:hypothetical protein
MSASDAGPFEEQPQGSKHTESRKRSKNGRNWCCLHHLLQIAAGKSMSERALAAKRPVAWLAAPTR